MAVAFLGRYVNLIADNARKQSSLGRKWGGSSETSTPSLSSPALSKRPLRATRQQGLARYPSVRQKYASRLEGGGDEGHAYFVLVLNYCLQVLKRCVRGDGEGAARSGESRSDDAEEQNEQLENRFKALAMEEDGCDGAEDDDDDDNEEGDEPAVRPAATEKVYTYETSYTFQTRPNAWISSTLWLSERNRSERRLGKV